MSLELDECSATLGCAVERGINPNSFGKCRQCLTCVYVSAAFSTVRPQYYSDSQAHTRINVATISTIIRKGELQTDRTD